MQPVETQTLVLYHTDLRGQWPQAAAAFAARLPYLRRLDLRAGRAGDRASLAGVALALRALSKVLGRSVSAGELVLVPGEKPRLASAAALGAAGPNALAGGSVAAGVSFAAHAAAAPPAAALCPDFSISHSPPWVGCAALPRGRVGFDIESGTDARSAEWVVREAALKATGEGLRALRAARELPVSDAVIPWRGERWHVQRLALFAGASACIVSSLAVRAVEVRAIALEELFAP
jgi:hypothetical protein